MKLYKGFTLIELLIVVAIIAILAAIAIPNFLQAQTRAKISRVQSDMRSVATALESYYIDHNLYPYPVEEEEGHDHGHDHDHPEWEGLLPHSLTTPLAYMSSLPTDVFAPDRHQFHYLTVQYQRNLGYPNLMYEVAEHVLGRSFTEVQYTMFSHGPDMDHPEEVFESVQYDPTNGTISAGSIWYFGPGVGFGR